jgi:hypothetical protein
MLVVVHTFYSCLKLTFVDDLAHLGEKYTVLRYLFVFLVRQSRKRAHDGIYCTPENGHCHSVYTVVETMWDGEDRENVPT